jgi:hypothetical protein
MDDYFCEECGQHFESGFDLVDHHIPEDEDEFDPAIILPSGYKLMIGSLLRFFYEYADNPEQIRQITQSTYVTLFAAEHDSDVLEDMIEDVVVDSEMLRFEDSLKSLLEGKFNEQEEGGE